MMTKTIEEVVAAKLLNHRRGIAHDELGQLRQLRQDSSGSADHLRDFQPAAAVGETRRGLDAN